ncbi:elongation factor Ts [Candidatus Kaiserbacteria bacterium]|nr:elongation factor Ts [Candidatus Kaiserbacteria bacterium]
MVSTEEIKQLRDETSVSIMQCKKALEEAGGDIEKAKVILRKISANAAAKKADRTLGAGVAAAYVHAGGSVVGAVVLASETDFVSKNEAFGKLAYDIAMHVAAMSPQFKAREDVKDADIAAAKAVFEQEAANVPADKREQAIQGKIDSYLRDKVLLEQPFVKDPSITVGEMINQAIQKFGEKVELVRFERLSVR